MYFYLFWDGPRRCVEETQTHLHQSFHVVFLSSASATGQSVQSVEDRVHAGHQDLALSGPVQLVQQQ